MVGVISLHSTDKAGPETWEVKRADGERAGYSRDRVGTHQHSNEGTTMKKGDIVYHLKLGSGTVIKVCKYGGLMIDYSDKTGVMVRISHKDSVERIDENHATAQKTLYNKTTH